MKFTIETKPLIAAVKLLSTIPYRKGIECSEFVALGHKAGAVTFRLAAELIGYAEVASDTKGGDTVFLDRAPLFPFFLAFESGGPDVITCELDGDKVKMRGGSRSATFTRAEVKGKYPDHILRDEKKIEWTEKQAAALGVLQHYVCTDAISPELTAITVSQKKKAMYASKRLAIAGFFGAEPLPMAGPYAASVVGLQSSAKGIYRGTSETPGIRLSFGKTHLTQLLKTEAANFPLVKAAAAFEGNITPKIKVEAGAVADVVGRLKACTGDSLDDLSVEIHAKASGAVELVTKSVSATVRETLKAKVTGDCQAEILWGNLHPLVSSLPGDAVLNFGWEVGPYHVWAKDSVYILASKKAK